MKSEGILSVSVAMCTYNGAAFIEEQLISIMKQTRKPDELIICDDKSQDNTLEILHSFAVSSGLNVRIQLNKVNIGYTSNFEQALSLCNGDLIFMADQDDIWYPEKIEIVCEIFKKHNDIVGVTHDGRLVDTSGKWHGTYKNKQIIRGYGENHKVITGALSCIKRQALKYLIPFPPVEGHDNWISYFFSYFPEFWFFSAACLEDIRRHNSNTSEWIANSFKSINKIDVFMVQICTSTANDYTDRLVMNKFLSERLQNYSNKNYQPLNQYSINNSIAQLNVERKAILDRQGIAQQRSKLIRWYQSFCLLYSGGYKYFNGWKSFLRDLTR